MALLTREEILTADDIKTEEVAVPEWGGEVLVRSLTGTQRDNYEMEIVAARDKGKLTKAALRAGFVARCVVDEQGVRLFKDADIQALGMKSAAALDRVFAVAKRMSELSEEDLEAMLGNSDETDGDSSPSVSPATSATPDENSSPVSTQAS